MLEHLSEKELDDLEARGLSALSDDALDRLELPKGYGIPKQPEVDGEAEWAKQNPVKSAIETASAPGKFVGENILAPIANAVDSLDEATDTGPFSGLKKMQRLNPLYNAGRAVIRGGKKIRQAGMGLEASADASLVSGENGPVGRGIQHGKRALGILAQNSPIPASAGEGALGAAMSVAGQMVPKLGLKATKAAGRAMEEGGPVESGISKLSQTSEAIIAQRRLPKIQAAIDKVIADKDLLRTKLGEARRVPDYGELGNHFKEDLADVAIPKKEFLIEKRKVLTDYASRYDKPESPALVIESAKELSDDLTGIISNSKDATVTRLLKKYTDLEVSDDAKAMMGIPDEYAAYRRADTTIADLQKDSTRLYSIAKNLREADAKSQARVIYKLRELVEDEIQRRMEAVDPDIPVEYAKNRAAWKEYFDVHESDFAYDLKKADGSEFMSKIFKTPESVSEAQRIMSPEAFEKAKSLKVKEILEDLQRSKEPEVFLKNYNKPGYFERIFGPIGAAQLEDFAHRMRAERALAKQVAEIDSMSGVYKYKTTADMFRTLGMGGVGAAFWAMNSPKLAVASAAIGVAPELMARAYVKAGPSMRASINALAAEGKLGKFAGTRNAAQVLAFVDATQKIEQEASVEAPVANVKPKVKVAKSMASREEVESTLHKVKNEQSENSKRLSELKDNLAKQRAELFKVRAKMKADGSWTEADEKEFQESDAKSLSQL